MHFHLIAITVAGVLAFSAIHAVDPEQIAEALRPEASIRTSAISQFIGLLHERPSVPNRPIQPNYQTPTSYVPRYDPGFRASVSYVVIPADHAVIALSTTPRQPPHRTMAALPHKDLQPTGPTPTTFAPTARTWPR